MLRDRVNLKFVAGKGGNGHVSFDIGHKPSGGTGGDGGNVYLEGSINVYDFTGINSGITIEAENGGQGGTNNSDGKNGKDFVLKVPLTTILKDNKGRVIASVSQHGERFMVAQGGRGGLGNHYYRGRGLNKRAHADHGKPGETIEAELNLELYSDVLLIGFPNAGKSSLLNSITRATSKVAPYAFTTLYPQLGLLDDVVIMDLPGLIEQTSMGKGLGTAFVKHTKSARLVAHILSLETTDIVMDYKKVRAEIEAISEDLATKPEIIILTKTDLVSPSDIEGALKQLKKLKREIVVCSVYDYDSLENLKVYLRNYFAKFNNITKQHSSSL